MVAAAESGQSLPVGFCPGQTTVDRPVAVARVEVPHEDTPIALGHGILQPGDIFRADGYPGAMRVILEEMERRVEGDLRHLARVPDGKRFVFDKAVVIGCPRVLVS